MGSTPHSGPGPGAGMSSGGDLSVRKSSSSSTSAAVENVVIVDSPALAQQRSRTVPKLIAVESAIRSAVPTRRSQSTSPRRIRPGRSRRSEGPPGRKNAEAPESVRHAQRRSRHLKTSNREPRPTEKRGGPSRSERLVEKRTARLCPSSSARRRCGAPCCARGETASSDEVARPASERQEFSKLESRRPRARSRRTPPGRRRASGRYPWAPRGRSSPSRSSEIAVVRGSQYARTAVACRELDDLHAEAAKQPPDPRHPEWTVVCTRSRAPRQRGRPENLARERRRVHELERRELPETSADRAQTIVRALRA